MNTAFAAWWRVVTREHLRAFQREHLRAFLNGSRVWICGARQIGKGEITTLEACLCAAGYDDGKVRIPAHDVRILSKDATTSQHLIRMAKRHLDAMGAACGNPHEVLDDKLGSMSRLALANGRHIAAHPGRAGSLQGFTGSVFVDELTVLEDIGEDPDEVLSQAMSVASARPWYRVSVACNADYEGSYTDRCMHSGEAEYAGRRALWTMQTVPIDAVYPAGLPPHLEELKRAMSPAAWRRWFGCEFIGGTEAAFDSDWLRVAAETVHSPHVATLERRVLALDIGHRINPSGVVVASIGAGRIRVDLAEHWHRWDADRQERRVEELASEWQVNRLYVDAGAVGYELGQRLQRRFGGKCAFVNVSEANRDRWAHRLGELGRTGRVQLPPSAVDLRADLAGMRWSAEGHLIVPTRKGPSSVPGSVIHADAGEALLYCMDSPELSRVHSPPLDPAPVAVDRSSLARLRGLDMFSRHRRANRARLH